MKKLLVVLVFIFIGQQAFSQMYVVFFTGYDEDHQTAVCASDAYLLTKIDPLGNTSYTCVDNNDDLDYNPIALVQINQELNSIINQGYKLIEINSPQHSSEYSGSTINVDGRVAKGTIWYFAIP